MNWLKKIAQNMPKSFRVAIDFDANIAQQLASQQLEGISGISDSQLNAMQWFNVARLGMLMMPGSETISMNNLSKMNYGNPDQMMQNNMELMMRIFNQRKPADVIHRLFNYIAAVAKNSNDRRFANIAYFMEYTAFWQNLAQNTEAIQVNSIQDLVAWTMEAAPRIAQEQQGNWGRKMITLAAKDWEYLIKEAINHIGKVYQDEGEWVVTDQLLRVPTGSTLYIMLPSISDKHRQMWDSGDQRPILNFLGVDKSFETIEERKNLVRQNGLDRLYKIRYVDDKRLSEQKTEYYQRMDKERDQQNNTSQNVLD